MKNIFNLTIMVIISSCFAGSISFADDGCAIKSVDHFAAVTDQIFTKEVLSLSNASSEGGEVTLFRSGSHVAKMDVILYGEWGKTEISYQFSSDKDFIIDIQKYYYSSRIGGEDVRILEIETRKFIVCDNNLLNYPTASNVKQDFDIAQDIIKKIKSTADWDQNIVFGSN